MKVSLTAWTVKIQMKRNKDLYDTYLAIHLLEGCTCSLLCRVLYKCISLGPLRNLVHYYFNCKEYNAIISTVRTQQQHRCQQTTEGMTYLQQAHQNPQMLCARFSQKYKMTDLLGTQIAKHVNKSQS